MRREDCRAALHQALDGFLDNALAFRLNGGCGLVQQQNARVCQKGAGDRQPLPLAAGKLHAPLPNSRVVALRQSGDKFVGIGCARRCFHVAIGCLRPAIADVVPHRRGKQKRVLLHRSHLAAQAVLCYGAQIMAVDRNRARIGVPKARHQRKNGAFARARLAHQGRGLAGSNAQSQRVQYGRCARFIRERDMVKCNRAADRRQVRCTRRIRKRYRRIQHIKQARACCDCALHSVVDLGEIVNRPEKVAPIASVGDQAA